MKLKKLLAAMALCTGALTAVAVPAAPWARTYTQPDGSSVSLSLRGDEHFHYLQDSHGYLVARDADGWYKVLDNTGAPTSVNASDRLSASDMSALAAIEPAQTFRSLQSRTLQAPRRSQSAAYGIKGSSKLPSKWDNTDGHDLRLIPTDGVRPVLVILVNFADCKFSFATDPRAEMEAMLNQEGYNRNYFTGSAADYFKASSRGVYQPRFDVYGPANLKGQISAYGRNDSYGQDANPEDMVKEACTLLDDEIDFSIYDTNGDGIVDNVYVFYAGYGENEGAPSETIWPHAYNLSYRAGCPEHDGVKVDHYACSNELTYRTMGGNKATHSGIGTFCHEFGHVLGLPDLYATSYTGAFTPGEFSIMDHGSYNNNARTPPVYSAYERYALEWEKPIDITAGCQVAMQSNVDGGHAYRITADPKRPTEYFLFENRQKHSWDKFIPHHGMLVWHIDHVQEKWDRNIVNNSPDHQYVDIVEADGKADSGSIMGDPFPGNSTATSFNATSSPALSNWNGTTSHLGICKIGESEDGVIIMTVEDGTGNVSEELSVPTPDHTLAKATDTSLNVKWNAVPGAKCYYVSAVLMIADEWGALVNNMVSGYEFKRVTATDDPSVTIEGLDPATSYLVSVYTDNGLNLSMGSERFYSTLTADFDKSVPTLLVSSPSETAHLSWAEIPGADRYSASVFTRTGGAERSLESVDFTNKKYPYDWIFSATFDSREGYYGNSAPSLKFTEQQSLLSTTLYSQDVSSISFWARVSEPDASFSLRVYSIEPNGSLYLLRDISDIKGTSEGSRITVDKLPHGVNQLMLLYTFNNSGLVLNMDDFEVKTYSEKPTDTPVSGYDKKEVYGTSLAVTGLAPLTDYVASLTAHKGNIASATSKEVYFRTGDASGISSAETGLKSWQYLGSGTLSVSSPVNIYRMDGTVIAMDVTGMFTLPSRGIFLIQSGRHTEKILY